MSYSDLTYYQLTELIEKQKKEIAALEKELQELVSQLIVRDQNKF